MADALSREFAGEATLNLLVTTAGIDWPKLQQELLNDPYIQHLQREMKDGTTSLQGYTLDHDMLRYKGIIVLPPQSDLVAKLLHEYHDSAIGGHVGEFKTFMRLASEWFWVGMRRTMAKYV